MIRINDQIAIDESEIELRFVHASGPGGQNVNKVATAVQLRFDVKNSPSLPEDVRLRLISLAGKRVNSQGVLVIEANRRRNQDQNRQDAQKRLRELIREAAKKPKPRKTTSPSAGARRRRLEQKRRRSQLKRQRRSVSSDDD